MSDLTEVAAVPGLHLPEQAFRLVLLVLLDLRGSARGNAHEDVLEQPDRASPVGRVRLIPGELRSGRDQLVVIMLPPELGDVWPVGLQHEGGVGHVSAAGELVGEHRVVQVDRRETSERLRPERHFLGPTCKLRQA